MKDYLGIFPQKEKDQILGTLFHMCGITFHEIINGYTHFKIKKVSYIFLFLNCDNMNLKTKPRGFKLRPLVSILNFFY